MWILETGQIGRQGEAPTTTLGHSEEASRGAAEFLAVQFLVGRGVSEADAGKIAAEAGYSWIDDFPTRSAIRIFER